MKYLLKMLTILLFITSFKVLGNDVSHGSHFDPDVGDKLGSGASFDYISPTTGYLGIANSTDHTMTITAKQDKGGSMIGTTSFSLKKDGHICFSFNGEVHFDVYGDGYIHIVEDSATGPVPKHCKNYFGLVPDSSLSDSAADELELIKFGIKILSD